MARKNRSGRRVVFTPTLPPRVLPSPQISTPIILPTPRPRPITSTLFTTVEDRRTFHPLGPLRSPRDVSGRATHRLVVSRTAKRFSIPTQVMFDAPAKVLVCVRRKTRKAVLHALKKTGKGGGRRPRRNFWSSVKC